MTNAIEIIAWLEIVSGMIGYLLVAVFFYVAPRAAPLWAYTLTGAFLALVIYAGRQLRSGTPRGALLSLALQVMQSVHVVAGRFQILFLAGPFVDVAASRRWIGARGGIGAVASLSPAISRPGSFPGVQVAAGLGFSLHASSRSSTVTIGINVIALCAAWFLWRALATPKIPSASKGSDSTSKFAL